MSINVEEGIRQGCLPTPPRGGPSKHTRSKLTSYAAPMAKPISSTVSAVGSTAFRMWLPGCSNATRHSSARRLTSTEWERLNAALGKSWIRSLGVLKCLETEKF